MIQSIPDSSWEAVSVVFEKEGSCRKMNLELWKMLVEPVEPLQDLYIQVRRPVVVR